MVGRSWKAFSRTPMMHCSNPSPRWKLFITLLSPNIYSFFFLGFRIGKTDFQISESLRESTWKSAQEDIYPYETRNWWCKWVGARHRHRHRWAREEHIEEPFDVFQWWPSKGLEAVKTGKLRLILFPFPVHKPCSFAGSSSIARGPFKFTSSLALHWTCCHHYRITPASVRNRSRRVIPYRTVSVQLTGLQTSRSCTTCPMLSATLTYVNGPKTPGTPSPTAKRWPSYHQSTPRSWQD